MNDEYETVSARAVRNGITHFKALEEALEGEKTPKIYPVRNRPKRGSGYTKAKTSRLMKTIEAGGSLPKRGTLAATDALRYYFYERWYIYATENNIAENTCIGCLRKFVPATKKSFTCSARCASRAKRDREYFGGNRMTAIGLTEGICQICGEKKKGLSAHHVLGKGNDPEDKYLMALCRGCHSLLTDLALRKFADDPAIVGSLLTWALIRRGHRYVSAKVIYTDMNDTPNRGSN